MNDFILVQDRHNALELSDADVQWLCDRRAGVGADGILRAVKAGCMPDWNGDPNLWFMDYRNADGSTAQMCGNGLRLFVRYLMDEDLAPRDEVHVATRAGERTVWELFDGRLRATMGRVRLGDRPTWVVLGDQRFDEAMPADVGNPHAVVALDGITALRRLDLTQHIELDPTVFPEGANVEFVVEEGPGRIRMRVQERGVGETFSCGTGVVASAAVMLRRATGEAQGHCDVSVRGGHLSVHLVPDESFLTGPAVVVARGEVTMPD
ncbi:MAG: diaminopimelate epimerase [Propionibacteriaceae bacterium]|nr:diaminopimelate epimerase [Propionibacteriaceae bacterium]